MADAQQGENVQVLAGLRHDAVVGGHDQDHAVDAAGPGHHGLDEVLVARHVDDAHLHAARSCRGKAQVDGHAALFLFLEPVGLAAGERLHQRRLAVVDVPGRAEGDVVGWSETWSLAARHFHKALPIKQACSSASVQAASRVDQHLVLADAGEDRPAVAAEPRGQARPGRAARQGTATSRVGRSWPGSEPPPICDTPSTTCHGCAAGTSRAIAAAIRSAWRGDVRPGSRQTIRSVGTSRMACASSKNSPSVASSAASVSLPTRTIRASGFLRTASTSAGLAEDDAALRGPDQLVGAGGDQVGPGAERAGQRRPHVQPEPRQVHQRPGPHVVDQHQAAAVGDLDQFLQRHLGR